MYPPLLSSVKYLTSLLTEDQSERLLENKISVGKGTFSDCIDPFICKWLFCYVFVALFMSVPGYPLPSMLFLVLFTMNVSDKILKGVQSTVTLLNAFEMSKFSFSNNVFERCQKVL